MYFSPVISLENVKFSAILRLMMISILITEFRNFVHIFHIV